MLIHIQTGEQLLQCDALFFAKGGERPKLDRDVTAACRVQEIPLQTTYKGWFGTCKQVNTVADRCYEQHNYADGDVAIPYRMHGNDERACDACSFRIRGGNGDF